MKKTDSETFCTVENRSGLLCQRTNKEKEKAHNRKTQFHEKV